MFQFVCCTKFWTIAHEKKSYEKIDIKNFSPYQSDYSQHLLLEEVEQQVQRSMILWICTLSAASHAIENGLLLLFSWEESSRARHHSSGL